MEKEKIIVRIDDEDVLELIPVFLKSRRDELNVLRDAVTQKDFDTLSGFGHKLKGSGGAFGFDRISEIGNRIELAAKAQDLSAIKQEISDLQDYLDRVEFIGT